MNLRVMRVIVFFDLPITTIQGIRAYTKFRRFLLKDGFIMMQESVYSKLAQNQLAANALISHIRKNSPDEGLIQILTVTEKQYSNMEMIIGSKKGDVINSSERMIVL
ncbi:CRISPR-associated endonuclease Cas2 [Solobacterium moorei]|uniref:CRISPR-associated endonuclease Cas2 n=1 Tax=Solobacterium moorei TaxID=102148 RepID=UPI0023F280E7|nr:CRISPR-associated endonuclease Cas2 [Solobacterium moorei]MDI6414249.1 CRISPR-associated endonuclease Cas2 [Solobacterium moorei]